MDKKLRSDLIEALYKLGYSRGREGKTGCEEDYIEFCHSKKPTIVAYIENEKNAKSHRPTTY